MTTTGEPGTTSKVKLGANYWKLWFASVTSNLGDGIAAIAYPWLASAVTRDPLLIALIAVAQRLPWLVFTLPAGVITDRVDRRKLMLSMDVIRTLITVVVAATVVGAANGLPTPAQVAAGEIGDSNYVVYGVLLLASLLFGMAEVLRDNAAQTFLPAIVEPAGLEKANGNLWGAEMVANSFVGPPLGSLLLGIGFAIPFFVDAGTFAVAAALVFVITGDFKNRTKTAAQSGSKVDWKGEISEGFTWLWKHPVLRPMAIILGVLNGLAMMSFATFILFAQENLDLGTGLLSGVLQPVAEFFGADSVAAFTFSLLMMAGAVGGVVGSILAAKISSKLGSGTSLYLSIAVWTITSVVIGTATKWWWVAAWFAFNTIFMILWNIITVSYRQTIIPDALLGRVNSVYRFFGWGMMPIGSILGGAIVSIAGIWVDRSTALRWPFFVAAAVYVGVFVYALPRLSTQKMEATRAEGIAIKEAMEAADARDAIAEAGLGGVGPDDLDDQVT
jgi:MFS family permease